MFEGSNQAALGHLAGVNAQNARTADDALRRYAELGRWYDQLKVRADQLQRENNALKLALAVAEASMDGADAVAAAWRESHPQSPLRQSVGKLKDGSPKTKALSIWITRFDEAARKRGITNPEAHRIS